MNVIKVNGTILSNNRQVVSYTPPTQQHDWGNNLITSFTIGAGTNISTGSNIGNTFNVYTTNVNQRGDIFPQSNYLGDINNGDIVKVDLTYYLSGSSNDSYFLLYDTNLDEPISNTQNFNNFQSGWISNQTEFYLTATTTSSTVQFYMGVWLSGTTNNKATFQGTFSAYH